jgi:hypothetical protein
MPSAEVPSDKIGHRLSDTERLKPFLQAVGSDQPELIFGVKDQLFHYTDLTGFGSIISNHDLWLTHLRYSNDEEEMLHGQRIVSEVIAQGLAAKNPPEGASAFLERVKQKLEQQVDVYICCFCLKDDLLSQWRGYGANGSGVSMGIDPQEFEWLTGPDSPPGGLLRVWKVFYEEDRQRAIIKELLQCGLGQPGTPEERAENTAAAIQFFVPTFKNASFHAEEECRMIFTPAAVFQLRPQFRIRGGMLVPYYSLKDLRSLRPDAPGELPLRRIRLGPSVNKILNKGSAEMMLKAFGYGAVPVDCSNIPFRG